MSLFEFTSLKALSDKLSAGDVSSVELTEFYLKRINSLDSNYNSFITIDDDNALQQAKAADQLRKQGDSRPLLGLPFAHKDIFCTAGTRTSCGSKMLDNFTPAYSATAAIRLNESGMVCLGKTNMDEFAMGSSNENSFYGAAFNPWNTNCVPGGSSGGSAAAVAAGLIPAATGTDTGGSVRQPAAFCGLTGIKPTYGRISRYGIVAYASSLDQAGVIARTAEDCAMMLEPMSGFDPLDSTSMNHPVENYSDEINKQVKGLTIGLPRPFFHSDLNSEMQGILDQAKKELEGLGIKFVEVDLPGADLAVNAYYIIAPAEASSNLSRYDGVRFGHRCEDPKDLVDLYERSRSEGFGAEVQRRILVGTYALSAGYYDAYFGQAQQVRRLVANGYQDALKDVDLIMAPVTPETAFEIGEKTDDPVSMYLSDIFTIGVNLAGLPAISVPAGFIEGMPAGMQLIGNHFDESLLLRVAHAFQQQTDHHLAHPEISS